MASISIKMTNLPLWSWLTVPDIKKNKFIYKWFKVFISFNSDNSTVVYPLGAVSPRAVT